MSILNFTREKKDELLFDFLQKRLEAGRRRTDAISDTQRKFSILHPQTVYNIEKRVKQRKGQIYGSWTTSRFPQG